MPSIFHQDPVQPWVGSERRAARWLGTCRDRAGTCGRPGDLRQEMPTRDPSQAVPPYPPPPPGQEPEALEGAVRGGRGKEVWVGSGPSPPRRSCGQPWGRSALRLLLQSSGGAWLSRALQALLSSCQCFGQRGTALTRPGSWAGTCVTGSEQPRAECALVHPHSSLATAQGGLSLPSDGAMCVQACVCVHTRV